MIITIISCFCLTIEVILLSFYIFRSKNHNNVFSKANIVYFIPLFLIMSMLYILSLVTQKDDISIINIVGCFTSALKSFALEIKSDYVSSTMNSSVVFTIAFYLGFIMSSLTILDSFLGLFKVNITNYIRVKKAIRDNYDFVLSNNEDSKEYIKNNKAICFVEKLSPGEYNTFFENCIPFISKAFSKATLRKLNLKKNKNYYFLDFDYEESKYMKYAVELKKYMTDFNLKNIYLKLETPFDKIEILKDNVISKMNLNIYIHCFSKHELISRQFAWNNPLTKFLPKGFINNQGCLENDKDINVLFLGFGKKGQELFKTLLLNNQFPSYKDGRYYNHLVNYYAFDKAKDSINNCQFSKLYRQLTNKNKINDDNKLCNFHFEEIDIFENGLIGNKKDFIEQISAIINDDHAFNYIIVTFDTDIGNLNLVNSIMKFFRNYKNIKYMVYLKNNLPINGEYTTFGSSNEILSHSTIVDHIFTKLGIETHLIYKNMNIQSNLKKIEEWEKLDMIEQYSNIYSTLNVKFKLNLMGLDLENNGTSLTKSDYEKILFGNEYEQRENMLNYKDYQLYFDYSLRNTLIFEEHLRWCTYYILNDYGTMKLSEIKLTKDNKLINKSKDFKLHACLIDFYKLDEYHKYVSNLLNKDIKDVETYKYDAMVIDNLYEFMSKLNINIYKKKDLN